MRAKIRILDIGGLDGVALGDVAGELAFLSIVRDDTLDVDAASGQRRGGRIGLIPQGDEEPETVAENGAPEVAFVDLAELSAARSRSGYRNTVTAEAALERRL